MQKTIDFMIQSMTGYGKATAELPEKKINVEIKSLNSKAMDLSARIAPAYREKEMEIRNEISRTLERGKVDFSLWVEKKESAESATPINQALVEGYYKQIKDIADNLSIPVPTDWYQTLLRMPDVLTKTETQELTEEEWTTVHAAVLEAIGHLVDFRKQEGAALEKKFRELQATEEFQALLESAEKQGHFLRQFRHKISLAFQNTGDGELNLLFTGDVQPQYMRMIAENYDGRIPLHEHYWCIKVPHHGTESHFFDFSSFSPENMMIPNGAYYDNSKKKSKNQRTSMQYGGLFYINDAHMYCSNCDCCDSYENGCSCREYDVISPSYYKDI